METYVCVLVRHCGANLAELLRPLEISENAFASFRKLRLGRNRLAVNQGRKGRAVLLVGEPGGGVLHD